jgi:WD40 repeat protein
MELEQKLTSSRRYAVFLSYRHADNKESGRQWATWLHHLLEGYEVPEDLAGAKNGKGDLIPATLYPVFRDEEELPADADLTKNIRRALENSDLLVVLCSPRAVESRFVADEIRYFKELGKSNRILAMMIDGEPNAADDPGKAKLGIKPEAECLPEPLRYGVADDDGKIDWSMRTEPIAADVRPGGNAEQGWTTGAAYREALHKDGKLRESEIGQKVHEYEQRLELAKLKVVAGSLGVPLGVLTQRDKAMQLQKARKRSRTLRRWLAAVAILAILAVASGIYSWIQRNEALKTASATDFAIADLKLQTGNVAEALAYLARSLRNNPSNVAAASRLISLSRNLPFPIRTLRHEDAVTSASFSPDGKWIVTSSRDKSARVWDAQTGNPVGNPMRHEGPVWTASFSPDGNWIVTASDDKTARIWDARTGKPVGEPMRHDDRVWAARFSPDGNWIVTASFDKTARIWNARTGNAIGTPMRHNSAVSSASFSPDGKWILTASGDGARVWDTQTGKPVGEPMGPDSFIIWTATFSPDGKWIATGSSTGAAQIWDAKTHKQLGLPMHHDWTVWGVSFSPDGKRIATASWDHTVRIWDAKTGNQVGKPIRDEAPVNSANFSQDGKWVVTASMDGTAQIWDVQTSKFVGEPLRQDEISLRTAVDFSLDGKWVMTISGDLTARIWDAHTGKMLGKQIQPASTVKAANFSPNGKLIVTTSGVDARVWDALSGKPMGEPMRDQEGTIKSADFSPDGRWIVTTSGVDARVWDAKTGRPVSGPMRHGDTVQSASLSIDGKRLATISGDQIVRIWDAQTAKSVGEPIRNKDSVTAARFSPDGKWIVIASGFYARVLDVTNGKWISEPMRHADGAVISAIFSPDGKWIVTAANDKTARVWDALSGKPVSEPMRHNDHVESASFSPDSKWVLTASGGEARIWDALTGRVVDELICPQDYLVTSASFNPDGKSVVTASFGKARIWEVGDVTGATPEWVSVLAEAIGGEHLNPNGVLETVNPDLAHLRKTFRNLSGSDDLSRFGRWFVADSYTRTISALSPITVPEFVSQRLLENTAESVEEAYNIDPGNPLILASLAKFEKDKDHALFLCRLAVKRAQIEGPPERIKQVLSISRSLFPDSSEFNIAFSVPTPENH